MRRVRALVAAFIACAAIHPSVAGQTTTATTTPVLIDRDMTVGAGATVSAAFGEAVARAEDQVVPVRLFAERGGARRTANIAYRFLKLSYFDVPQERWLMVANHEIFGHGARLRERFDGSLSYEIDAPAPYGPGGGATLFTFDREPTSYELLTVSAAGMEANSVAADLIATRAFAEGRMRPRDAMRYLAFELDTPRYILRTGDQPERPGHDVSDFLLTYNDLAASIGAARLRPRTLRRETLVSFANPMLGFALFGIARHVWNGNGNVPVPALSLGSARYLPLFRYRLAPYGTEWTLTNELGGRVPLNRIDLRIGRAPGSTPWGIGLRRRELTTWRSWRVDVGLDIWRQPRIDEKSPEITSTQPRFGVEARGRLERPLIPVWFGSRVASVIVDVGVKSAGYVPGEPLRSGVVVRGGVGLPLEGQQH